MGPSRVSACRRRKEGLPATEKYSGRTTRPAPAPTASSTRARRPRGWPVGPGRPSSGWRPRAWHRVGPPSGTMTSGPRRTHRPAAPARNEMSVVSFEDSDVVRSAIRVEGFRDDEFNYQLIRALGVADYGGSTVGECLSVAAEIADGSPSSWAAAFERLAQRVEDRGRACLEAGHRVSGRDHFLRASTYYRTAEYYADGVERPVPRDGGAEPDLLRRGRRTGRPAGGAGRCALRGRVAPRLPGPPTPAAARRRAAVRHWSGWAASTPAPRSCTSTWEHQAPSGDGTSSSSTVRAARLHAPQPEP